jgi:hypothetical protein
MDRKCNKTLVLNQIIISNWRVVESKILIKIKFLGTSHSVRWYLKTCYFSVYLKKYNSTKQSLKKSGYSNIYC